MTGAAPSIMETRRDQMFPTLDASEVDRLRRFGVLAHFAGGQTIARVGEVRAGLMIIVSGQVVISQSDELGRRRTVVTEGPGGFMGELAQLTGRPSLVDGHAEGEVETLVIPPERLRALLVAEADLGERIMRALILRRVSLIQGGAGGPVLIGPRNSSGVLRLQGFLTRNGFPHHLLDPDATPMPPN